MTAPIPKPANVMLHRGFLLGDQLVFSAANFMLTITLARIYSEVAFAAYTVALSIVMILSSFQRNLYILRVSLLTPKNARRYLPGLVAEHWLILLGLSLLLVLFAGLAATVLGMGDIIFLLVSSFVCGLIFLQVEFDRVLQIKMGSRLGAFLLSGSYALAVVVLGGLAVFVHISYVQFMASLAAYCLLKGIIIMMLVARPNWRRGWIFLRADSRQYALPAVLSAVSYAGFTHFPVMILAAAAPAQVAVFGAMRSLTQPIQIIIRSMDVNDKNHLRNLSGGTVAGARRIFWRTFRTYSAVGVTGLAFLSLFSTEIIRLAYGHKYSGNSDLMLGWSAFYILLSITLPIQSIVNIMRKDNLYMAWNMGGAALGLILAVVFSHAYGARGAMLATLTGCLWMVLGGLFTIRPFIFGKNDASLPSERHRPRKKNLRDKE